MTEYPEENPYKVSDSIRWKVNGKVYTVGDDFGEITLRLYEGAEKTHIITNCGRVLSIDCIKRV